MVDPDFDPLSDLEIVWARLLECHAQAHGDDLVDVRGGGRHEEHSIEQLAAQAVFGQSIKIIRGPAARRRVGAQRSGHHGLLDGVAHPSTHRTGRCRGGVLASDRPTGQDMRL